MIRISNAGKMSRLRPASCLASPFCELLKSQDRNSILYLHPRLMQDMESGVTEIRSSYLMS